MNGLFVHLRAANEAHSICPLPTHWQANRTDRLSPMSDVISGTFRSKSTCACASARTNTALRILNLTQKSRLGDKGEGTAGHGGTDLGGEAPVRVHRCPPVRGSVRGMAQWPASGPEVPSQHRRVAHTTGSSWGGRGVYGGWAHGPAKPCSTHSCPSVHEGSQCLL